MDFCLSIDERLISHNEEFRRKLKNKVIKAFIEQIDEYEKKPGIFEYFFSKSNAKEKEMIAGGEADTSD